MPLGHRSKRLTQVIASFRFINDSCPLGDIQIRVRDVKVLVLAETVLDHVDLRVSASLPVDTFLIHASELDFLDTPCYHAGNLSTLVIGSLFKIGSEENRCRFSRIDVVHGTCRARLWHSVLLAKEPKPLSFTFSLSLFLSLGQSSGRTVLVMRVDAVRRKTSRCFNLSHRHVVGHSNILSSQLTLLLHSLAIVLECNDSSVDALSNTLGQSLGSLLPVELLGLAFSDLYHSWSGFDNRLFIGRN
ncbi:hypothetical protein HG530_009921 [Fusarium avenaceum]|nr:hypothetical protein HG530_009921 [Fusarium avenaceum]